MTSSYISKVKQGKNKLLTVHVLLTFICALADIATIIIAMKELILFFID